MSLSSIKDRTRRAADLFLARFLPTRTELDYPPVFLVGAPRAGTTLLYQLMVRAFRLAYINNLLADFPRSGPVLANLMGCRYWPVPVSLQNSYGRTPGWSGPSEGGRFWHMAIPPGEHHEMAAGELCHDKVDFLRRSLAAMVKAYRAPFISKNVLNSVRMDLLDSVFPGALFIVCRRDPVANAKSVLAGRRRTMSENPGPWSVVPRKLLDKSAAPVPAYVAWQIIYTYEAIAASRKCLGENQVLDVHYEELCRNPEETMEGIHRFLEKGGSAVERRTSTVRTSLEPSAGPKLSREDELLILNTFQHCLQPDPKQA